MRRIVYTALVVALATGAGPVVAAWGTQSAVEQAARSRMQLLDDGSGYGPWRFGMSTDQVEAVEAHAPYEIVRASMGGLETTSGPLGDGIASISFVFNGSDELYLIRVWYDLGETYDDKLRAFYRTYVDISERFGAAQVDTGYPLDPGMTAEEFMSLVPDRFAPTGEEFEIGAPGAPAEFNMDPRQLRIAPVEQTPGVRTVALFVKVHPTTSYLANVLYQSLDHSQ